MRLQLHYLIAYSLVPIILVVADLDIDHIQLSTSGSLKGSSRAPDALGGSSYEPTRELDHVVSAEIVQSRSSEFPCRVASLVYRFYNEDQNNRLSKRFSIPL